MWSRIFWYADTPKKSEAGEAGEVDGPTIEEWHRQRAARVRASSTGDADATLGRSLVPFSGPMRLRATPDRFHLCRPAVTTCGKPWPTT